MSLQRKGKCPEACMSRVRLRTHPWSTLPGPPTPHPSLAKPIFCPKKLLSYLAEAGVFGRTLPYYKLAFAIRSGEMMGEDNLSHQAGLYCS